MPHHAEIKSLIERYEELREESAKIEQRLNELQRTQAEEEDGKKIIKGADVVQRPPNTSEDCLGAASKVHV